MWLWWKYIYYPKRVCWCNTSILQYLIQPTVVFRVLIYHHFQPTNCSLFRITIGYFISQFHSVTCEYHFYKVSSKLAKYYLSYATLSEHMSNRYFPYINYNGFCPSTYSLRLYLCLQFTWSYSENVYRTPRPQYIFTKFDHTNNLYNRSIDIYNLIHNIIFYNIRSYINSYILCVIYL